MTRFYYMPRPYPDELIGSVLVRAARHWGQPLKRFGHQLAGKMSSTWPLFLSSHLAVLAEAMSLTAEGLLYGHTMFPYSTARMGPLETARLAKNIIELRGKSLAVLVQSAAIGGGLPRFCHACIQEDLAYYGESFWHRRHNLPFIQRCSVHGESLLAPPMKANSAAIAVTRLPEECEGYLVREQLAQSTASVLMHLSIGCLEERGWREELEWRQEYRQLAEAKVFPRQGTGLSGSSLLYAFKQFYGEAFLQGAGLDFDPAEQNAWPILLLRTGYSGATSTPRHLLVQAFLESSTAPASRPAAPPGKKLINRAVADASLEKKVRAVIAGLSVGSRISVSELLTRAGGWAIFRHNRRAMPLTSKAVLEFRGSDFSERQLGRRPYWRKRLGLPFL